MVNQEEAPGEQRIMPVQETLAMAAEVVVAEVIPPRRAGIHTVVVVVVVAVITVLLDARVAHPLMAVAEVRDQSALNLLVLAACH